MGRETTLTLIVDSLKQGREGKVREVRRDKERLIIKRQVRKGKVGRGKEGCFLSPC